MWLPERGFTVANNYITPLYTNGNGFVQGGKLGKTRQCSAMITLIESNKGESEAYSILQYKYVHASNNHSGIASLPNYIIEAETLEL